MISSSSCLIKGSVVLKLDFGLASRGAEDTFKRIYGSQLKSPPEDHSDVTVQVRNNIKYKLVLTEGSD